MRYVMCIDNDNYPASLKIRKVYGTIADPQAKNHAMIRVIDESGEDYLYPEKLFVTISLPATTKRALLLESKPTSKRIGSQTAGANQ